MSVDYDRDANTIHTWPTTNRTWRQRLTQMAERLIRREPQHEGATPDWHPAEELPPPAVYLDPVIDGAITSVMTIDVDELGQWQRDMYDLEPARIFDAVLLGTDAGRPFAGVATDDEIQQWATDGAHIDDQTTDTTGEKDQ